MSAVERRSMRTRSPRRWIRDAVFQIFGRGGGTSRWCIRVQRRMGRHRRRRRKYSKALTRPEKGLKGGVKWLWRRRRVVAVGDLDLEAAVAL